MVLVELRLLFHVQQVLQASPEMLHHNENAELIFVLGHLGNDDVQDLRCAEEVDLLLHLLQLPHELNLSDDLDAIVVPLREAVDVFDGHMLSSGFAYTFHHSSVASLAQYSVQGVALRDLVPRSGQLRHARLKGVLRNHLFILGIGRNPHFLCDHTRPLISVDKNLTLFLLNISPELALQKSIDGSLLSQSVARSAPDPRSLDSIA